MDSHIFLADFYREVVRMLWLDEEQVQMLVEAELTLEEEILRAVPHARFMTDQTLKADKQVVFFSTRTFPQSTSRSNCRVKI
jgi:hypothetical protein